jgi:hypothetical protein
VGGRAADATDTKGEPLPVLVLVAEVCESQRL